MAALFLRFIRIFEICNGDVERLKFRAELIRRMAVSDESRCDLSVQDANLICD